MFSSMLRSAVMVSVSCRWFRTQRQWKLAALVCMAIFTHEAQAADISVSFDEVASLQGWSFSNGGEFPGADGRLAWEPGQGREKRGCLGLDFDFRNGGNYVAAIWQLPAASEARAVGLWLHKIGPHRVAFRGVDSSGRTFQKQLDYTYPGWQQIEVDLGQWTHAFGGTGEAGVQFPMRQFAVLIENTGEAKTGRLLIDDLELLPRPVRGTGVCTYVGSDFRTAPAWHATGGRGNTFSEGRWSYLFNGADSVSLRSDFTLLGRPRQLRLVLEGGDPGLILDLQLASHFQRFQRELGRVEGGEQTLAVPIDDCRGWKHFGGQNDGLIHEPLRVMQLILRRGTAGASGELRLKRLEVETDVSPDRAVVLIPSVGPALDRLSGTLELRNLRPDSARGRLRISFHSLSQTLEEQEVELTLPPNGVPVRRNFERPVGEFHMLDAEFAWVEAGLNVPPVSIGLSTLPPAMEEPVRPDPASPMGVGLYLYRWRGDHRRAEQMDRLAELAARAGVKWIREEFNWGLIEPSEGHYAWEFYDQLIEIAGRHGISVYGLLCYWSAYAQADTSRGIDQYCAWVRQVVRRYKDRVRHWEIWNEPNIFFWSGPKELYPELLSRAYEAVKQEDPAAVVMGCSTSGIDADFIRMVMRKGGRFDALTIHPYRGVLDDLKYLEELQAARKLVGDRPVWITEIGFPSHLAGGYSERAQASLLARTYLLSLAGGMANVAWYDFRNDGANPFDNEQNFGVVRSDFTPKPAYRALCTIGRLLAGLTVQGLIEVGEGAHGCRFRGSLHDVVAVCAPVGARLLSFETAARVEVVNAVGERIEPLRSGGRWTVTLDAGFPVYIQGRSGFEFRAVEPPVTVTAAPPVTRPGGVVELTFKPAAVQIDRWSLPLGWSAPQRTASGVYQLIVPSEAVVGPAGIQVVVQHGGLLRIPVSLRIQRGLLSR